ncbi:CotO family spore coat protein [Bacillus sp. B15-48]|uniref:CotO family spore coat protein n=1 Tax=Bacillus sp. B15-48 TaxID=1548601 RepID=UPI00193FE36A|nr:CotO family spore coat protein [Bacillus sp. B15-48]MBM4764265.1 hypothetical protein [Bacillus sp. B15-48]
MSVKKLNHKPMLYIHTPITQFPDIIVQNRYSVREEIKNKKTEENLQLSKNGQTKQINDLTSSDESKNIPANPEKIDLEELSLNPFDTTRRKHFSMSRVKNFKDMDISEKLVYLENFPAQLKPVSCLYFTEITTYAGVLLSHSEEEIEIMLPNKTKTSLNKGDLQDIKMLGFH